MSDDNSKIVNLLDDALDNASHTKKDVSDYAKNISSMSNINNIKKSAAKIKPIKKSMVVDTKNLQRIVNDSVDRSMTARASIIDKSLSIKNSAESRKAMKAISGAATIVGKGLSKLTDVTTNVIDNNFSKVGLSLNDVLTSMKESTKKAFYSVNPLAGVVNESAPVKQAKAAIKNSATFLLKKNDDNLIPRMSKGGVVGKKGLVELHPGEIVMPLSKAMKVMDLSMKESKKTNTALQKVLGLMPGTLKAYESDMQLKPTKSKTFVSGFIRSFINVNEQVQLPWQKRLIRSLTEIRVGMLGDSNRFKLAFERTLVEHPVFRGIFTFTSWLTKATKGIFGIFTTSGKSKYARDIPKSTNAMSRTADTLRVLYIGTMERLDKVLSYQEQSHAYMSRQLTGEENNLKGSQAWTTKWQKFLHTMGADVTKKDPLLQRLMDPMSKYLGLDKQSLKKAGYNDIKDIFRPVKTYKLITKGNDYKEAPSAELSKRQPIPVEDRKSFEVLRSILLILNNVERGVNKDLYSRLDAQTNNINAFGSNVIKLNKNAGAPILDKMPTEKKPAIIGQVLDARRNLRDYTERKNFNKTLIDKVNKISKFEERSFNQDKGQITQKEGFFAKIKRWVLWLVPLSIPFLKKMFKWTMSGIPFMIKNVIGPLLEAIPGIGYLLGKGKALYKAKRGVDIGEDLLKGKKAFDSAKTFSQYSKTFKLNAEAAKLYATLAAKNTKTAQVLATIAKNKRALGLAEKFVKIAESPAGKMGGKILGPVLLALDFATGFMKGAGGIKGKVSTGIGAMLSSGSSSPTIRLLEGAMRGAMIGTIAGGPPGTVIGAIGGAALGLLGAKNVSGVIKFTITALAKGAKGIWWIIKTVAGGMFGFVKSAIKVCDFILNTIGAILTPWKSIPKMWKKSSDYLVEAANRLTGWMYDLAEKFKHPILAYKEKQMKDRRELAADMFGKDSAKYKQFVISQAASGRYNDVFAWEAKRNVVKDAMYAKAKTKSSIANIEDAYDNMTKSTKKKAKQWFKHSDEAKDNAQERITKTSDKIANAMKAENKSASRTIEKLNDIHKENKRERKIRTFFGRDNNTDKTLNFFDKYNPLSGTKNIFKKLDKYLDRHDVDMDKKVREVINYGGKVRVTEVTTRGAGDIRSAFNTDTLSKRRIMNKMDETNDASKKALKDATDMMTQVYNKSTRTIVTSINNTSNNVSNSDGGIKEKFSRMHEAIDKMINGVF